MHRLYLDGLALSPPSPTMLDLRDAMLQADLLRNPDASPGGSANHCRIWNVFAGRGLGQGARDTEDTGDNTVVASDLVADVCPQTPRVTLALTDSQAAEAGLDPATFTVTRTGGAASDLLVAYSVSGIATPDALYDASDLPLGSRPAPELLPNESSVSVTLLTVPVGTPVGNYFVIAISAGTAAGTHYLIARADGDSLVPETNENNNTRITPVAVTTP